MTKYDPIPALLNLGFDYDEARALRRISMTLHRWHELECGDGNDRASWCITRGREANGSFEYDDKGRPYIEHHVHSENKARYEAVPDRETGAKRRLAAIMGKHPTLQAYVQTDPRGAALYILRPDDVMLGQTADSSYSRGLAVY